MALDLVNAILTFLVLVAAVLGLVPVWVPFLEERPHLVRRVRRPLAWIHRWWRVVFADVVLLLVVCIMWMRPELRWVGVIVAVGFPFWWFWKEIRQGIRRLRRRVLWGVIIGPARDHFGVEAAERPDATAPRWADEVRRGLRQLDLDSLRVLEGALARRKPGANDAWAEWPEDVQLDPPPERGEQATTRLSDALRNLRTVGVITDWSLAAGMGESGLLLRVWVPTSDGRWVERVHVAAQVELVRREMRQATEGSSAGSEGEIPTSGCKAKIRDLSRRSRGVLAYLLWLYCDHPGEVIYEDLSDPGILTSPLKSLERAELRGALKELEEAGFLEEPQWEGDKLRVRVTECLARKSVAGKVADWLDDLMAGGL